MWTRAVGENFTENLLLLAVAAMNAPSLTSPFGSSEMAEVLKRTSSSQLWFEIFRWFRAAEQPLCVVHMKSAIRDVRLPSGLVIGMGDTAPTMGSEAAR